jgi:adenylate cyclase class IV
VELEVVLNEGQTCEEGESIAKQMMKQLDICQTDLVEEAYIDLLNEKR